MHTRHICHFNTRHVPWPWLRQTENGSGCCDGVRFLINAGEPDGKAEWLAVFDSMAEDIETRVPRARRILIVTEPPEVAPYPPGYLRQFGIILSPFPLYGVEKHAVRVEGACLNWHFGVRTSDWQTSLDSLEKIHCLPVPVKRKLISAICSTKTYTREQRERMRFVEALARRFGTTIDIFGRGRRPIDDKAEAIVEYKYHIVLENNRIPNFWTEKLSDVWIGYSLPLYVGPPNIQGSLPDPEGIICLSLDDYSACFATIEKILETDPYETVLPALKSCRRWCLESTNVFSRLAQIFRQAEEGRLKAPLLSRSESIKAPSRWKRAIMRKLYRYSLLKNPS